MKFLRNGLDFVIEITKLNRLEDRFCKPYNRSYAYIGSWEGGHVTRTGKDHATTRTGRRANVATTQLLQEPRLQYVKHY